MCSNILQFVFFISFWSDVQTWAVLLSLMFCNFSIIIENYLVIIWFFMPWKRISTVTGIECRHYQHDLTLQFERLPLEVPIPTRLIVYQEQLRNLVGNSHLQGVPKDCRYQFQAWCPLKRNAKQKTSGGSRFFRHYFFSIDQYIFPSHLHKTPEQSNHI